MAARVEQSRALVMLAATTLAEGSSNVTTASSAWRLAAKNAIQIANDAVLIHGAIGFTWECDAHLYLKRAHTLSQTRIDLDEALDHAVEFELQRDDLRAGSAEIANKKTYTD